MPTKKRRDGEARAAAVEVERSAERNRAKNEESLGTSWRICGWPGSPVSCAAAAEKRDRESVLVAKDASREREVVDGILYV